jgi:hypothetical protein
MRAGTKDVMSHAERQVFLRTSRLGQLLGVAHLLPEVGEAKDLVKSLKDIPIQLTDKCWKHISRENPELIAQKQKILETVANPKAIFEGDQQELLAVTKLESEKWLVVVYREFEEDGFIITAYPTREINSLKRRTRIWP